MEQREQDSTTYPRQLRDLERDLLRSAERRHDPTPAIGVALSGGGIRSATFSLGVFQAWAKRKFLSEIDVISTVSGGGYFGAFFGRLLSRSYIRSMRDAELVLGREPDPGETADPAVTTARKNVVNWLRENGRYLSPRGSGDTLLMAAVMLRNWVSVHVVLGLLAFAIFQALQLTRSIAGLLPGAAALVSVANHLPGGSTWLWWSPWVLPGLAVLGVLAVPLAWAYWLASNDRRRWWPVVGLVGLLIGLRAAWPGLTQSAAGAPGPWPALSEPRGVAGLLLASVYVCLGWVILAAVFRFSAWSWLRVRAARLPATDHDSRRQFIEAKMRSLFSTILRNVLILSCVLIALGVIDTLGQTIYALTIRGHLRDWVLGIGAVLVSIGAAGRQLVVMLGGGTQGKRLAVPVALVTTVFGLSIVLTFAMGYDLLAQGVRWQFGAPCAPASFGADGSDTVTVAAPASQHLTIVSTPGSSESSPPPCAPIGWPWASVWLGATCVLAVTLGRSFSFVNESSHQALYAARLTRAYLGASNPERWNDRSEPVINPIRGDDIEMSDYWQAPDSSGSVEVPAMYKKGAPLHIVNVTINETFGGRSQLQQKDRKGLGMALGPAGISVGAGHHLAFDRSSAVARQPRLARPAPIAPGTFKVFQLQTPGWSKRLWDWTVRPVRAMVSARGWDALFPDQEAFPGERLSIGRWIAISGAAFSTGMGARTNLGLSLLLGLTNVRLGYWWDAGVDPDEREGTARVRPVSGRIGRIFERVLPAQKFLASEMISLFPGIARRYWYLSDGGHFENMGGYELIRRRLRLVIVVDGEQDASYTFEGLANLVRKARIDFDAEITMLSDEEIREALGSDPPAQSFGPLDMLRPECKKDETPDGACDPARLSGAHVTIAKIEFDDERHLGGKRPERWLFYLKTSLTGDEPTDVIEYARRQPPFPQQTTADQFFDEAQWESYRRLGEHIGNVLLDGLSGSRIIASLSGPPVGRCVTEQCAERR